MVKVHGGRVARRVSEERGGLQPAGGRRALNVARRAPHVTGARFQNMFWIFDLEHGVDVEW